MKVKNIKNTIKKKDITITLIISLLYNFIMFSSINLCYFDKESFLDFINLTLGTTLSGVV